MRRPAGDFPGEKVASKRVCRRVNWLYSEYSNHLFANDFDFLTSVLHTRLSPLCRHSVQPIDYPSDLKRCRQSVANLSPICRLFESWRRSRRKFLGAASISPSNPRKTALFLDFVSWGDCRKLSTQAPVTTMSPTCHRVLLSMNRRTTCHHCVTGVSPCTSQCFCRSCRHHSVTALSPSCLHPVTAASPPSLQYVSTCFLFWRIFLQKSILAA